MPKAHPNLKKMQAAVAGWIEAGMGRMDGAEALAKRAGWVADQIAILGNDRVCTPPHLEGLTFHDLFAAQGQLESASRDRAAKIAAIRERVAA